MSQSDSEQQLRIWKDLAISKQMLMNEAASTLKLKDDFSADELRESLELAIKRAEDADDDMARTRDRAAEEIEAMQLKVRAIEKARNEADAQRDKADDVKKAAEQALATGRQDNSDALKKAKRQVEEKQKELKAINVALADTPENIVRKLKTLKKQKLDEANGRKLAEDANRRMKKEIKEQKEELESLTNLNENSARLLVAYRDLREQAEAGLKQLKDAGVEADALPEIDSNLLAEIETATASLEEPEDTREAATA